eukprot:g64192.t1
MISREPGLRRSKHLLSYFQIATSQPMVFSAQTQALPLSQSGVQHKSVIFSHYFRELALKWEGGAQVPLSVHSGGATRDILLQTYEYIILKVGGVLHGCCSVSGMLFESFGFGPLWLRLWVWRLWKSVLHFCTGLSELERIARRPFHWYMPVEFESALVWSQRVPKHLLQTATNPGQDTDLKQVLGDIVAAKRIPANAPHFPDFQSNCLKCLGQLREVSILVKQLDARAGGSPFNPDNPQHETMVLELWDLLRPGVRLRVLPPSRRVSSDWDEIGFQGKDPATDFRGMGMLGLSNLIEFARQYPTSSAQVLKDCMSNKNWFGFAITGINLTHDTLKFVKNGTLKPVLYHHGATLTTFLRIYVAMFLRLNELWHQENPPSVMSFQHIRGMLEQWLVRSVRNGSLMLPEPEKR